MTPSTAFTAIVVAAAYSLVAVSAAFAGAPILRVPEPGTLALIGAGAAVLTAHAWWRNRK